MEPITNVIFSENPFTAVDALRVYAKITSCSLIGLLKNKIRN